MLRMIRKRFKRTTGFLVESFWAVREKKSGCAREAATGGLSRRSFCSGSRRFSKESADVSGFMKHSTMALEKEPSRRNSSTFAVSSCNLKSFSYRIDTHYPCLLPDEYCIKSSDLPVPISQ